MVIQAGHILRWLREVTQENDPDVANWGNVVALIQAEFQEGSLAEACAWKTVLLIPKGDYKGF